MNSKELLYEIENTIDKSKLYNIAKLLNRNYNLYLSDAQLWKMVINVFGEEYLGIFSKYQNIVLANQFINDVIFRYFPGERIVKYHLVNEYLTHEHEVILFEMNADDSRVDLCRINGNSYAFEIKTELDNLNRLYKQVEDYSKIFEFVYVITHYSYYEKVKSIIPEYCGIVLFNLHDGNCIFKRKLKAKKSPNLDSIAQLRNLSSNDIRSVLIKRNYKSIPPSREERVDLILRKYKKTTINQIFKEAIRIKFNDQWNFVRANFSNILPIDIQTFFHQPIEPELAYFKDSCIV